MEHPYPRHTPPQLMLGQTTNSKQQDRNTKKAVLAVTTYRTTGHRYRATGTWVYTGTNVTAVTPYLVYWYEFNVQCTLLLRVSCTGLSTSYEVHAVFDFYTYSIRTSWLKYPLPQKVRYGSRPTGQHGEETQREMDSCCTVILYELTRLVAEDALETISSTLDIILLVILEDMVEPTTPPSREKRAVY